MKTKIFVITTILILSFQVTIAQKLDVNKEKSTIAWLGKKIGGQHEGYINVKSGSFELSDDQIETGTFSIDMTSITCTDLKDASYNQKLVGHLKSDDFFAVEEFPTAYFKVTESSKFSNGKANITGEVSIKGKTESISFEVDRIGNEYSTTIALDRSKFDVRYGSKSFFNNLGDKAIDDVFTLEIKLVVNE